MKKEVWVVKQFCGYKRGWVAIKEFDSPANVDEWIMDYMKKTGVFYFDLNVVRREV